MNAGSIVKFRNREWVLLPSDSPEVIRLRPLTGVTDDVVKVHRRLSNLLGYSFPEERVSPATFPLPHGDAIADAASTHLLWQATRLTLREAAAPFRSLGRISIRPRTYQFVPLLMGLRIDPVRLLIADDVGVGKTIEALLIAREMLDRGEIKRFCVLCPPYLCDQWQKELAEKFNLDAVLIRSGTVAQLDRAKTRSESIYRYYPTQVISIDFVKSDRNRHAFLLDCPELVIVDEAHGVAVAGEGLFSQHQRHELVQEIAAKPDRHLLLLTATPHSGIDSAFRSLLELLDPQFSAWIPSALNEAQRSRLAGHFVQRTRRDIEKNWEGQHCFPQRDPSDETYRLSSEYSDLFNKTYEFCREMVRSGSRLAKPQQRVRYWGALALLRCVMSSPAAALAALAGRYHGLPGTEDEIDFRTFVFESSDDRTDDNQPTPPVQSAEETLNYRDRRRLRGLGRHAAALQHKPGDTKLTTCISLVRRLLNEGYRPILWCRYIATADYLAEGLTRSLANEFDGLRVVSITGNLTHEERRAKVEELLHERVRVLVATDCLSEGINLQQGFNATLHYDLPWNPNRLEQREGRVDRYGQTAPTVKTIRYFSPDSPVDGVVLEVLLDKAREIHRVLGTHVPVPEESETVTEAVLNALFLRGRPAPNEPSKDGPIQLTMWPKVASFHRKWDLDAEREKVNRTRFAQRTLKPEEVRRELEATDAVLGDPEAVRLFVLNAAQRLGLSITEDRRIPDAYRVATGPEIRAILPDAVSFALPDSRVAQWLISFVSPTPEGAEYLGRNHRFVTALAQFLLEEALVKGADARAARSGVIRTTAVPRLTTLYLIRVRYLLEQPDRLPALAEEVQVLGRRMEKDGKEMWLSPDEALLLLSAAKSEAIVSMVEKRELVSMALDEWERIMPALRRRLDERAAELLDSHRRVRRAVAMKVRGLAFKPQLPPDLLGMLILQPMVKL
ncbi:MAG TPA: helicase-related protein [Syntrophobacteraceae bacterium]|nr:helicase-related protein [Syntrophobacteraceae bacterium]